VCVCVVLCMNTWRHEHMVVCINECMYVYMTLCMSTFILAWSHIFMHIYVYVCMYVCMFGCMNACVMSIPDYASAVMHSFCVCVCVFVFVCVCLFLLCFCHSSQSEWRKGKEWKGKQRDGMGTSVFCIVYTTRYVSCKVLVQIMKGLNHHSIQSPFHSKLQWFNEWMNEWIMNEFLNAAHAIAICWRKKMRI